MASATYQNFDLHIEHISEKGAPHYRAEVIASPAGEASHEFTLVLPPADAAIDVIGRSLFENIFSGELLTCLRRSQDKTHERGEGLRIRLRLADVPELASLSWEALYDPSRARYLALSNDTPLVRYLDLPEPQRRLKVQPPLRLLAVIAAPRDYPPLNATREWETLRHALSALERAGLVALEQLTPPTLSGLRSALRRQDVHILHFIGHGLFDPASGEGYLLLEDEQGAARPVTGPALAALLGDQRSLRLVLLNACQAGMTAADDPYTGIAGKLVQQGIPAVVAMRAAISDPAAITFAREFYAAVADGFAVDAALTEARKALFTDGAAADWTIPALFMRAADGRIFDLPAMSRADASSTPPPVPATTSPESAPVYARRSRPALGGDSISHYRGGAATFGCLVQDRGDPRRVYILCDASGLCPAAFDPQVGDLIVQPGIADSGQPAADVIATLARWTTVRDDPLSATANFSAALAEVRSLTDVSPELRDRGCLRGIRPAQSGQQVFAVGRTSGQMRGMVLRTGARWQLDWPITQVVGGLRSTGDGSGAVPIPFGDLIECTGMLQMGDSGAVLMDAENYALGLGFAGNDQLSAFIPLQKVLDALNVQLVTEATWRELTAPHLVPQPANGYAAFISYAAADRQWVFETLLPHLEQAGLRVIVDVRDFPPGRARLDNITWAVEQSCHTIAVLTPEYLAEEWQAFETLAARTTDPAAWRRKLLPLQLKKCPTPVSITAIALEVADLTDPYAARYALPKLVKALS